MSNRPEDLLATAVAAAHAGAAVLRRYFRSADLEVAVKGENDFVTRADRESEAAVLGEIRRRHPTHRILAEESGRSGVGDGDGDGDAGDAGGSGDGGSGGGGGGEGGGSGRGGAEGGGGGRGGAEGGGSGRGGAEGGGGRDGGGGGHGGAAGGGVAGAGHEWLVDPLDGTTNFLQGLPVFCVSVACRYGDQVVAAVVEDPIGGNLFTAALGGGAHWNGRPMSASRQPGLRGAFLATGYPFRSHGTLDVYLATFRDVFLQAKAIRRCGAAALDLAYTAAGVYDGFFEFRLSPWDIGAGVLLVREAGGVVTDVDGGEGFFASGNVVAGAPPVQRELRQAVAAHASEAEIDRLSPAPASPQPPAGAPGPGGPGKP